MCMITYIPRGITLTDSITTGIENGAFTNGDGHGWAVAAETGLMLTGKSLHFYQALDGFERAREQFPDAPALFHSRWATHGSIREDNCHPFPLGPHSVMAHNGVMPSKFQPSLTNPLDVTDSLIFARHLERTKTGLWSRSERRRIARLIPGSKLCILSVSPRFTSPQGFLVNAGAGVWRYGAWFSNYGFEDGWKRDWHDYTSSSKTVATKPDIPECRWCGGYDTITSDGYCTVCDSCQDCGDYIEDCECFGPSAHWDAMEAHDTRKMIARTLAKSDREVQTVNTVEFVRVDADSQVPCSEWACDHRAHEYVERF